MYRHMIVGEKSVMEKKRDRDRHTERERQRQRETETQREACAGISKQLN